jgi:hypothetical protein
LARRDFCCFLNNRQVRLNLPAICEDDSQMSLIENRAAIGPLHRQVSLRADGQPLPSVADMVATLRPSEPLHCIRPAVISGAAHAFSAALMATCSMP